MLRALYALLVVLFSFAVPAQALDSSMALAYLDDCFGEITEPSIAPAQILASEAAVEKVGEFVDEVDEVAITGPNDTVHVPVGAIKPGNEMPTVEYSSLGGDILPVHDTIEQSTRPERRWRKASCQAVESRSCARARRSRKSAPTTMTKRQA